MTKDSFRPRCSAIAVKRVAIISAGMIGAAWAGRCVANNISVKIWDPAPSARQSACEVISKAWRAIKSAEPDRNVINEKVRFCKTLDQALEDVDFVQESAPEKVELKQDLLKAIDMLLADDVLVASSTSGFSISKVSKHTENNHRFVVGHPYNPPYIIPFVEIVAGPKTSPSTTEWLSDFYSAIGMRPVVLSKEVDGFIGNRLQQAVWHEALHMLKSGEATVEQMELAFTHALGPRWALMGPFSIYSLAGGDDGMKGFLEKFADSSEDHWTRLKAPEMNDGLKEKLISQSDAVMASYDKTDLENWRDHNLIQLLRNVRASREE